MSTERVIVHVDMDAFFAAVEQLDEPSYRGRPVVVGADPRGGKGRGVVATCSYEARRFGIHSAQPIGQAYRLCPEAVFVRPRGERYEEVSRAVMAVLEEFTPDIEPVGIDESFLDITATLHLFGGKRATAEGIRGRIREETQLGASLGVAPCKMVAKIASDLEKPGGLVIVEPHEVEAFLRPLAVGRLWGVGEKTEGELKSLGVRTIGELADMGREELRKRFGKAGEDLWELSRGRDDRPVEPPGEAKSLGAEHTFDEDTSDERLIRSTLMQMCERVAHHMRQDGWEGRTVTVKLRVDDFTTFTRARTLEDALRSAPELFQVACENLERVDRRGRQVRLIGVSVSGLRHAGERQTALFDGAGGAAIEKRRRLDAAIDRIKRRFGEESLQQGTSLPARPRPEAEREG